MLPPGLIDKLKVEIKSKDKRKKVLNKIDKYETIERFDILKLAKDFNKRNLYYDYVENISEMRKEHIGNLVSQIENNISNLLLKEDKLEMQKQKESERNKSYHINNKMQGINTNICNTEEELSYIIENSQSNNLDDKDGRGEKNKCEGIFFENISKKKMEKLNYKIHQLSYNDNISENESNTSKISINSCILNELDLSILEENELDSKNFIEDKLYFNIVNKDIQLSNKIKIINRYNKENELNSDSDNCEREIKNKNKKDFNSPKKENNKKENKNKENESILYKRKKLILKKDKLEDINFNNDVFNKEFIYFLDDIDHMNNIKKIKDDKLREIALNNEKILIDDD